MSDCYSINCNADGEGHDNEICEMTKNTPDICHKQNPGPHV